jgi:conjugative relaxase-like TrwC/TraI family protein
MTPIQEAGFATAVYRWELAARLRSLGYELERKRQGEFEIKGYTPEYLQASSPAASPDGGQIKEYLEKHGVAGAEAAEIAAHRTREAKRHLRPRGNEAVEPGSGG